MADRGRDLKFAILSDADKFDLDGPARDLDTLARRADDTGRDLDRLEDSAKKAGRAIDGQGLARDTQEAGRELDRLGDDAGDTARKTDSAFDKIARSSKSNFRDVSRNADRGMRDAKKSTETFRDEAKQNLSEVASSFQGDMDSAVDVVQGTLGGIVGDLGPVGIAVGAAGAGAVGLIYSEVQKTKEAISELASELTQEFVDASGQITEEFIQGRIQQLAADDAQGFANLAEKARLAGVSVRDVVRAKAGDIEAADRLAKQLGETNDKLDGLSVAAGTLTNDMLDQQGAVHDLQKEVGITSQAYDIAKEASAAYSDATKLTGDAAERAATQTRDAFDDLRASTRQPIKQKVTVDAPSAAQLDRIRRNMLAGLGTLVVPVRAGQTIYSNTADNSRYRW